MYEISTSLVGSVPYYTSSSPELLAQLADSDESRYMVFKDHSILPCQVFKLPSNTSLHRYTSTKNWLRFAKLPTLIELSALTYNDVMLPQKYSPFVTVILLNPSASDFDQLKAQAQDLAMNWKERNFTNEISRNFIFIWVDCERWKDWITSMYQLPTTGYGLHRTVLVMDPYVRHTILQSKGKK